MTKKAMMGILYTTRLPVQYATYPPELYAAMLWRCLSVAAEYARRNSPWRAAEYVTLAAFMAIIYEVGARGGEPALLTVGDFFAIVGGVPRPLDLKDVLGRPESYPGKIYAFRSVDKPRNAMAAGIKEFSLRTAPQVRTHVYAFVFSIKRCRAIFFPLHLCCSSQSRPTPSGFPMFA